MSRHPAFEDLCALAERHRLHVLLFVSDALYSDALYSDAPSHEFRLVEALAVVAPGETDPIVGARTGGELNATAERLLTPLRRVLKETA